MFVEPYLGNVTVFAGNFAPRAWMFCQGQLMSIAENNALYALIGTTYGGDGQVTFALPDLRSRVAIHQGQGTGLSNYTLGQASGIENVTLLSNQMPAHNHQLLTISGSQTASTAVGTLSVATNNAPASGVTIYSTQADGNSAGPYTFTGITPMAGSSAPFSIIQPVTAMNFIIATEGIFPSRN